MGPDADGWHKQGVFEDEAAALALAEELAGKPHPGAGDLADQVVIICSRRSNIYHQQRDGR